MPDLGEIRDRTFEFFFNQDSVRQVPQRGSSDPLILAKWQVTNIKSGDVKWHIDQAWTSFLGEVDAGDFGVYGGFLSDDGIGWNDFNTSSFSATSFTPFANAQHGSMIFGDELFIGIGGRVGSGDSAPGRVKEAITLFRISLPFGNSIKRLF